jgi:hypothetical protein
LALATTLHNRGFSARTPHLGNLTNFYATELGFSIVEGVRADACFRQASLLLAPATCSMMMPMIWAWLNSGFPQVGFLRDAFTPRKPPSAGILLGAQVGRLLILF